MASMPVPDGTGNRKRKASASASSIDGGMLVDEQRCGFFLACLDELHCLVQVIPQHPQPKTLQWIRSMQLHNKVAALG